MSHFSQIIQHTEKDVESESISHEEDDQEKSAILSHPPTQIISIAPKIIFKFMIK
jgi:hypothetical protein